LLQLVGGEVPLVEFWVFDLRLAYLEFLVVFAAPGDSSWSHLSFGDGILFRVCTTCLILYLWLPRLYILAVASIFGCLISIKPDSSIDYTDHLLSLSPMNSSKNTVNLNLFLLT
jgi:hypothetical protein